MKNKLIFDLNKVNVEFEKHAINRRSLREALGAKLKKVKHEKIIALQNINLQINTGEHIGIIGRNGAGKSTLLKVLAKVIIPNSGKVFRKTDLHLVPLLELGIGFQPDLSGRENCFLAGYLMGYTKKEIEDKLESIIEFSELGDFMNEPVKNYSSGMYARLAFAIATDINPDVLLIDEVFGVGDEFFMKKCNTRLENLMAKGITTVFVSHNTDFLSKNSERMIWIENGQVMMDGNSYEVADAYRNSETILELKNAI